MPLPRQRRGVRPGRRLGVPLGAALILAGCAAPAPPVPAHGGLGPPEHWSQPVPAGQRALAEWWRAFGDATLVDLVDAALRHNTQLAVARANLRQARAARDQAAAALRPALQAGASTQRQTGGGGAAGGSRVELGLDAGWELDLFGATAHGVAAQEALLRASGADLARVQVSLAAEVALAYLDLRSAQVRSTVARENLASQQETLQISRWRQQAGLASSLEVEQALAAVEQTRAQLPALQAAASRSAHALAVLVDRLPGALLGQLAAAAPVPQPGTSLAIAVPAQALLQRPDLLAAEQQLRAAAEEVARADALRRPGAQLTASIAWSGLTLGSAGSASAARALLASIAQPLADGGRLDAQLAGAQAAFDASQASYRAQVLAALQEVEDALATLASDRERLAALERALAAARNASLLATQQHASGLVDFQTVLETQRTLLAVQDSVASQQAALAAGHVRLYKALGGGWQPVATEQDAS